MNKKKVIVLGIDGACWEQIMPYIDDLPNFRSFVQKGCWGNLVSCVPPVTFPAWKCYSTGRNPDSLGVYWWVNVNFDEKKFIYHNANSFKGREIWDYLGDYGYKSGVINMPGTYPPKKINGFIVSGIPAEDSVIYTYPPNLKEFLVKMGYRIHPQIDLHFKLYKGSTKKDILNDILNLIEKRFEVAKFFLNDVDFLHVTIFYWDFIHHFFGNDEDIKFNLYKKVDAELGELMRSLSLDTYIFLVSDHGLRKIDYSFRLNEWLKRKGYIKLTHNPSMLLERLGFSVDKLAKVVNISKFVSGVVDGIIKYMPKSCISWLKNIIPTQEGFENFSALEKILDLEETLAFALGTIIFCNKNKFSSSYELKRFKLNLKKDLIQIKNPDTEEYIFENVWIDKELYPKTDLDAIFVLPKPGHSIYMGLASQDRELWLKDCVHKWVWDHTLYGIFGVIGPGIKNSYFINNINLIDLAPTMLHIFNVPIPSDIDGRLLKDIFVQDSINDVNKQTVQYRNLLKEKIKKNLNKFRKK